ncbi:shikimate dehydrogenase [Maridesulfovibrio ferrireducens]|uniref:shikimate dehydrogenase n=1 Tax=Maridesulfovibrio ferrireducens TaxID=246191 RepID=UPI001A2B71FF|nr:shikimate dehydrogenase [Maridesulfovibrio ferrireducens]MBI9111201.1 shikimate dehydrogenase [Maridesulfovibrio ferrireducens]
MNVFRPEKLFGIIGFPLGHSMSPLLHNWGFSQKNIKAAYMAWPTTPEKLGDFMTALKTLPISGASVTIPHKMSVMNYIDKLTPRAKSVGAVNTLYWKQNKLIGDNTDTAGCSEPLRPHCDHVERALLIGAGGAARAAIVGLKSLKIKKIFITNRTKSKADALADEFEISCVDWDERGNEHYDLVINSTSLGMSGDKQQINPMIMDHIDEKTIVYDLVYNPLETIFLRDAKAKGSKTISGIEMFLHQGLAQFKLWTNHDLDELEARKLLLKHL